MTILCVRYWLLISLLSLLFFLQFIIAVVAIVFCYCGILHGFDFLVGLSHLENRIIKEQIDGQRAAMAEGGNRRENMVFVWRSGIIIFTIWTKSAHFLSMCVCCLCVSLHVLWLCAQTQWHISTRKNSCMKWILYVIKMERYKT